jgi:gamma-glutamylcyclotransferase (GGCT)/AIG2-like uncharacterized protein YtfP
VAKSATPSGWSVTGTDLDEWLLARGQVRLSDRICCLGYGSNMNPSEMRSFVPESTAVVVLSALLVGAAAAYCSSSRDDGQFPAGLVAEPHAVEEHGLLLIDPASQPALDGKEGARFARGAYRRCVVTGRRAPIRLLLEDGTEWVGGIPVYVQHGRRLAVHEGTPVLLADHDQHSFADLGVSGDSAEHGMECIPVTDLPALRTAPTPFFVYGTLRPGQSRWLAIREFIASVEEASISGTAPPTGHGYPGFTPGTGTVQGVLLHPHPERLHELTALLDWIEGHPDLFCRELHRLDDGQPAWVYRWVGGEDQR